MIAQFCRYFGRYIFFSKTKQRLLLLSIVGLFISSFSLLVLQSTMGGLQGKLIERSKRVLGDVTITLVSSNIEQSTELEKILNEFPQMIIAPEREVELLLKNGNFVTPVIAHGIDFSHPPQFLKGQDFQDLLLPQDIAFKVNLNVGKKARLIAPGTVDTVFEDIPRMATLFVDGVITTDVPEIDMYHIWVRGSLIQNLIKKSGNNKWRLYGEVPISKLKEKLEAKFSSGLTIRTWEEENNTLVWALRLETVVMIFLFVAMTMLVALCITSGLMIFFDKIKKDLVSFWILGSSKKKLTLSAVIFLNVLGLVTVGLGIACALGFLWGLDNYGGNIMPDVFIDRKIPIHITVRGILISFGVPYLISSVFSLLSLLQFQSEEEELLEEIRSVS